MNTIVALATPPTKSTIHIIRLSGPRTYEIINKISINKIKKKGNSIQRTKIIDNKKNKIIDDVLLMKFIKPKSFTGEDLVEINCHGNILIVDKIVDLILYYGAIIAQPGEFTKQSFLNNKIDISQANAINYLINASTEFQIDNSLNVFLGNAKNKITTLKNSLFNIIGNIKVNIDYPEYYDVEDISNKKIYENLNYIHEEINKIIDNYLKNFFLLNKINLIILGRPNSGKSSLLNCFLKYERSIVSLEKGTTRDFIQETINIDGLNFNIIDTAGIRESNNEVENKGIEKALEISKKADLILYLIDTSVKISNDELIWIKKNIKNNFLIVKNKIDIEDKNPQIKGVKISTKNNDIDELNLKLKNIFKNSNEPNSFILSNYEKNILQDINTNILNGILLLDSNASQDIILSYLEYSYKLFKKFLGIDKDLDLLDELFKNFCLGK